MPIWESVKVLALAICICIAVVISAWTGEGAVHAKAEDMAATWRDG